MDAYRVLYALFKNIFSEILKIPVHAVARENKKAARNDRFHFYLNKVDKVNPPGKGSLRQWIQGIFFSIYAWSAGPVDGTDIYWYFVELGKELPFNINMSSLISWYLVAVRDTEKCTTRERINQPPTHDIW